MNYWQQYVKFYTVHFSVSDNGEEDGLPYLRDKLFISILLITLPISIVAYIPSLILSILTHQFVIGIFDTIALLLILYLFFNKKIKIRTKKIVLSTSFYLLAIILLAYLGTMGPGVIILLLISILITLFHSKKAGLIAIGLNGLIFFSILLLTTFKIFNLKFLPGQLIQSWIVIGINFIAFNTLIVLAVSFLVDQLNQSFLKEKKLQAQLKTESLDLLHALQKAEESDRLKSAFLNNMSHEVRTPLNSIIGFSELLTDKAYDVQQKVQFIHQIITNGNHLLKIISDILDISKLESGEMKIKFTSLHAKEFLIGIHQQFSLLAESKNLKLKLSFPDLDEKTIIFADTDRLKQILNNLISNAIKFTLKGFIEIGCQPKANVVEFYVRDTGIGIPTQYLDKIFDRFRQVEDAKTRTYGGNGLGLAISKNLVELMGGKISVESEPGEGSVFYFTLPHKGS